MNVTHQLEAIDFEWDSDKAETNVQKHGVSFTEACEVFLDPFVYPVDAKDIDELDSCILAFSVKTGYPCRLLLETRPMQLPIIEPAPLVTAHAEAFRDLFENRCQFRHFENYLTGLMVLPNKSMANIARCVVASSDKTNVSRYFSQNRWLEERVNRRRVYAATDERRAADQRPIGVDCR